jgi:hypothetical protein
VRSVAGDGTTFTVRLPRHPPAAPSPAARPPDGRRSTLPKIP